MVCFTSIIFRIFFFLFLFDIIGIVKYCRFYSNWRLYGDKKYGFKGDKAFFFLNNIFMAQLKEIG